MEDLHLIDFVELELKSKGGFSKAYDIAMSSGLEKYLTKFLVIQPGDWPCQFYCRQLVYQSLPRHSKASTSTQEHQSSTDMVKGNFPPVTSLIPTMGPLHISLNSREHVFETFKPFFKTVYNDLFPSSKLADKPKPWRINLILETVYGGWTLIRQQVMAKFKNSKDYQYGVLFNLLDNYLPLVLTIYTFILTFKQNNFREYFNAMIRIWVMFLCFKRRHYNKSPLVWLSNTCHWKDKHKELYEQFCTWPTIYDEYPVENTHSIIRAQTKPSDTANKLQQRAKTIFESKTKQANFRSTFTPPKQFSFSQQQLDYLKVKCAATLTNIFTTISKNINVASTTVKRGKKYVHLPHIFGHESIPYTVLPLGLNACQEPDQDCMSDLNSCTVDNDDDPWKVFHGCWHSFHERCHKGSPFCPICQKLLESKTKELGNIAKAAILNPEPDRITESVPESDDHDESSMMEAPPSENTEKLDEEIKVLSKKMVNLASPLPPPKPLYHHKPRESSQDRHIPPPTSSRPSRPSSSTPSRASRLSTPSRASLSTPSRPSSSTPARLLSSSTPSSRPSSSTPSSRPSSSTPSRPSSTKDKCQPLKEIQNIHQHQHSNVSGFTEWLLPSNVCQTNITGTPMASNACTIIASLWCWRFLLNKFDISSCKPGIFDDIMSYQQTIFTGNVLYNSLNLPPHQPNLEVRDVILRIKDLKLKILNDVGFFSVDPTERSIHQDARRRLQACWCVHHSTCQFSGSAD
ncbi:Hypothetical predicted protein [Paramuricea clavata]|uniref:Uncharacterized protein n=1 Tax=Paramuricea clavata TaxID=317549 RepID=A0A6S7H4D9_PARCT|nr:Hypothetical predicted protein [Paramuricea clavata]